MSLNVNLGRMVLSYGGNFVVVQSLSHVQLFVIPWTAAWQGSLSFTISWSWLKLMFIALIKPSNNLILYHPLLLLPSIFPGIRIFSNESALCIRWPKYQSFSISPSNEYSGLISFRIDWFDLLALKRLSRDSQETSPAPQFKSIDSSVLSLLYGLMVTSIHDYQKKHSFDCMDLCQQSHVSPFNMLSRMDNGDSFITILSLGLSPHLSWGESDLGAELYTRTMTFQKV